MDDMPPIADYMKGHRLMLVTAESCTAGLIASRLAEVPGAGKLLECAYVVYSPEAKQRCLGVRKETIERCNLTSEEVAREMAAGALARSDANLAVSNTGVTDDTDPRIPAGTQCFAWPFAVPTGRSRCAAKPAASTATATPSAKPRPISRCAAYRSWKGRPHERHP